ncbi:hypothetical protein [Paracoccus sp. R86501]|uniref:hypothetical protein n=1 Tax=Paracoccus sp. R86501 TaxID=3101711 RepID=UPI003672C699
MSHPTEAHGSGDASLTEDARDARSIVVTCIALGMTIGQATSFAVRSIESRRKLRL